MVVGIGIVTFRLHDCRSLKGKRKVVKSIIAQVRNKFNASVAEVGMNDVHQRAEIGFTLAGNDRQVMNSKIDKILNMIEDLGIAEVIDSEMEINRSPVRMAPVQPDVCHTASASRSGSVAASGYGQGVTYRYG